jgi:polyferredoxin
MREAVVESCRGNCALESWGHHDVGVAAVGILKLEREIHLEQELEFGSCMRCLEQCLRPMLVLQQNTD